MLYVFMLCMCYVCFAQKQIRKTVYKNIQNVLSFFFFFYHFFFLRSGCNEVYCFHLVL